MEEKKLSIILKPTSACNLRCTYCYHFEMERCKKVMSVEEFESICQKTFPFFKWIDIIWHGGEPLLMPLSFYKETQSILKKYSTMYGVINNVYIQTNGTLLTQEKIDFFKKEKMIYSMSFDGLDNDLTRGHTKQILSAFQLTQKNGLKPSSIQVLTNETIDKMIDNYEYYKSLNVNIQFNYVFQKKDSNDKFAMSEENYLNNVKKAFDHWFFDTKCNISVTTFSDYILNALKRPRMCKNNSCLGKWISIDAEGNLTPCGRNYPNEYSIGNIHKFNTILDVFYSDKYLQLISDSIERRKKCIEQCSHFEYCRGGCNNDAIIEGGIKNINGFSCNIFRETIDHVNQKLELLNKNIIKVEDINPYAYKLIYGKQTINIR